MHGTQPHQLGCAVDEIHTGERCSDERTHAVERELKDVFGPISGEKCVDDFTDRDQLANSRIDVRAGFQALGRRHAATIRSGHAVNV